MKKVLGTKLRSNVQRKSTLSNRLNKKLQYNTDLFNIKIVSFIHVVKKKEKSAKDTELGKFIIKTYEVFINKITVLYLRKPVAWYINSSFSL